MTGPGEFHLDPQEPVMAEVSNQARGLSRKVTQNTTRRGTSTRARGGTLAYRLGARVPEAQGDHLFQRSEEHHAHLGVHPTYGVSKGFNLGLRILPTQLYGVRT